MRRVLILGGTAWLGSEIARHAIAEGSEVVCLARGKSGTAPRESRFIAADRTAADAYDQLQGEWDDVIELAYEPELVESALEALSDRARHWTLVSTVSVYRQNDQPGADESADLLEPEDLTDYAHAKVAAERVSAARLGGRLLIARPGLIAGPGDPSDRLGYWPARLHRGGVVLAPTMAGRYVQVIDVADLAAWIVRAGRSEVTGIVNAVGESCSLESFFAMTNSITGFTGEVVTVDDPWLLDRGVHYWAGPRSLPLWIPVSDAGFAQRSNFAYHAAGGASRSLHDTITRVLADERARGVHRQRRSGLTAEEEADLLERAHWGRSQGLTE